ncbi:hypothetical protein [Haloferax gibbonsii]|uniref:DUF304 domain-containing protein n=1 Tax=Haloferax gibbonsii TaxID=35746 RepID=A0A0K1IZI1_HALGI|nr:hypothetical protein [Haloferax gibbonsii]AKU09881.1 hypothetical protein ABY42_18865 [Haloferax gibbonsii]
MGVGDRVVSSQQAALAHLEGDEEVLGSVDFSWLSFWRYLLIGLLLTPIGVGLLIFPLVYRAKKKSGCMITTRRIIHTESSLFSSATREVQIKDIRSISNVDGLVGGGVRVDTGGGHIQIGVRNSAEMMNVIREQMRRIE